MGFVKSEVDLNLYYNMVGGKALILILYVDNLFLTRSPGLIGNCKRKLIEKFEMKDLGLMHYFLRLEVWQTNEEIFLYQRRYVLEILKKFKMMDFRPMSTPMITNWRNIEASKEKVVDPTLYRQLIGSLIYLVNTSSNICSIISTLSQFMVEPKLVH